MKVSVRLAVVGAVALLAASCGSGDSSASDAPVTVTATTTVTTTATATETLQPPENETEAAPSPSSTKPRKVVVPNAVGRDYQTAQDLWRAAGLIVAPAIDATGRNRIMVLDSNWVVLKQDPKGGTKMDEGETITATVRKFTD